VDLGRVDDDVAQVGAGRRVEGPAAGDEAQFRAGRGPVDPLGGKAVLGIGLLGVHAEHRHRAIGAPVLHIHAVHQHQDIVTAVGRGPAATSVATLTSLEHHRTTVGLHLGNPDDARRISPAQHLAKAECAGQPADCGRHVLVGDAETGGVVMKMEEGLDTGPVGKDNGTLANRVPIAPDATAGDLHDHLARLGADLMVRALSAIERGSLTLTPQPQDGVTYASKIDKDETRIDWARPWQEVHNHIRGLSPFPGAWFELMDKGAPVRVKVLRTTMGEGAGAPGCVLDDKLTVACGRGAVRILELQRAGRQPMAAQELLRGTSVAAGMLLS